VRSTTVILARFLLGLALVVAALPQDKSVQAAPSRVEAFYSGTIAELEEGKVTVSRTVLGTPAEKRTFMVTPETKVEGKMRVKSRVTVRFMTGESGDVALSILVREREEKKK